MSRILIFLMVIISLSSLAKKDDDIIMSKFTLENFDNINRQISDAILFVEESWYCYNDLVSAMEKLNSLEVHDRQVRDFIDLLNIQYLIKTGRNKAALELLDKLEENDQFSFRGRLQFLKGQVNLLLKNYLESYSNYVNAKRIFKEKYDSIALVYTELSFIKTYASIDNREIAKSSFLEGLGLCQKLHYNKGTVKIYRVYGEFSANFDVSYAYDLLSAGWDISKNESKTTQLLFAIGYLKFMLRYEFYNEFNKGYNSIINMADENCLNPYYSTIYTLKAHYYEIHDKIDSVQKMNKKALFIRKKNDNKSMIGYSYLNLLGNSIELGLTNDAKQYLDSAYQFLYTKGEIVDQRYYFQYALKYNEFIQNNDSIIKTFYQLQKLENQWYDYNKSQYLLRIKAVNDLNVMLQKEKYEIELKNRQVRIWYTSLIAILLLILAIGLFFLLKDKSKRFNRLRMKSKKSFLTLSDYKREIKQLKNIFENAITGFFILNTDGKIRFANKKGEQILGVDSIGLMDQQFSNYFDEDHFNLISSTINSVAENFENKELEIDISNLSNTRKIINLSFSPMIINDVLESVLVIALDVTGKIRALELEKDQAEVLQTLFNSVTESILLLDGDFRVKLINNTGARRLGKTVDEVLGQPYFNILPQPLLKTRKEKIQQSIDGRNPVVYSEDIDSYNTMISYFPSFNADGSIAYIAEFAQDVTERRLAHEQINSLRQKVLRSQMNPHFIFNSLNAIQSYVLKNEAANAVKYLSSFAKLIRMILDSSRFDYINLSKEIDILKYYLDLQQLRFGERFSYKLDIDPEIDLDLVLIPAMLAQPFIENSIEHGLQHSSQPGVVQISFEKANDHIVFKVIDNGIGREASQKLQEDNQHKSKSLSTQLFKERLFTLNKFSGKKIHYEIVDLKDDQNIAKGTMVIINLPIMYRYNAL